MRAVVVTTYNHCICSRRCFFVLLPFGLLLSARMGDVALVTLAVTCERRVAIGKTLSLLFLSISGIPVVTYRLDSGDRR